MASAAFGYRRQGDEWLLDEQTDAVVQRIFDDFTRPYMRLACLKSPRG